MSFTQQGIGKKIGLVLWFVVFVALGFGIASPNADAAIGDAVDNTGLVWTTGGNASWYGQSDYYYYDNDAAQSGAIGDNGQTYIQTTVAGPGTLTYYWKVSSESGYDYLRFYVDGNEKGTISGTVDWTRMSYFISSGTYTLKWTYTKDSSQINGSDCGWIDKVGFSPVGTPTPSGTVTVSGTTTVFTTIQAGVDACSVGGTVSVSAGTYTERITITKRIALVGIGTPTINPSVCGPAVTFDGDGADKGTISGFWITSAILFDGYAAIWPDDYSMGILCKNGADPTITNNTISGNSDGIDCSYSSPTITNNTISGNSQYGIYCYDSSPTITNNTINGNKQGICCNYSSSPLIGTNTISGNSNHGISCDGSSSSPTVINNTITGNSYDGIYCKSSSLSIINNIITRNARYGIFCDNSSSPTITNNTITGNGWNGISCANSSPSVINNVITENGTTSTDYYGISCTDTSSTPQIDYNCVWGNGSPNNYRYCTKGQNDISDNPQFIGNGDYHLKSVSSCIDKGNNSATGIPSTDKDGKPRIAKGIVDMGAYEYQKTPVKIKIVDENNQEITTKTLTTDDTLTLYLKNYDAEDTMIGDVAGTWTLSGEIGTYTPRYGTSIVFSPTKMGTGTISAQYGTMIDTTGLITVAVGSITRIKIVDSAGQEITTKTLITDRTLTLYCQGYDSDNNLIGYVAGTWTVSGGIGNCTPGYGTSTVFNATTLGAGTISVRYGYLTDTTELITVMMGRVTVYNSEGTIIMTYATIQEGVNNCPIGGTVSVSAGTYTEAVYINKRIALVGVGNNNTIITAKGLGNTDAVTFDGIATNKAIISGFIITGATMDENEEEDYLFGSGIFCKNGACPTITNNTISGNKSSGITCGSSSPAINSNTISENSVGIHCWQSSSFIINNIITGNKNGGIICYSSSLTITNNTLLGNECGIYCELSSPKITNNIIAENNIPNIPYYGIFVESGSPIISYNNVWGNGTSTTNNYYNCSGGLGSMSTNPQFIGGADYHLQSSSPCINKGINTASGIPSIDKDGNPRISNSVVDMGAYEYQDIPITGSLTITSTTSGAKIYLDNIDTGFVTNHTFTDIPSGTHPVKLTLSGYNDWYGTATITAGLTTSLSATLIDPNVPTFTITVSPDPAGIGTLSIMVTGNEPLSATPTLTIKDTANATITATVISYTNGTYTYQATITPACTDGTATIIANGTDMAGNPGSITKTFQISIPRTLEVATGTSQTATVTTTLVPFTVKLTDTRSNPVGSCSVTWQIMETGYGASLSSTSTTTNINGTTSSIFTIGTKTGTYMVTANAGGLKATFTATATPGTLSRIIMKNTEGIEIGTYSLTTDGTLTLYCLGYDTNNNLIGNIAGTWTVNGGIGTCTPEYGTVTVFNPTKTGTITISARIGTLTATATITVTHGQPTTLTPATCTLTADGSQTFSAKATDSDGNQWDETNITWSTNDPTGTISGNTYYPSKAGTWTITGTTTNGKSGTATVVVKPGAFVNLKIMLPATVTTNAAFTVTVSLSDSKGNPYSGLINITNTTKSINLSTITVTEGTGTATATITSSPSGGTDTITVTCGTVTATATLVVFINSQNGGIVTDKGVEVIIANVAANVTVNITTATALPAALPGKVMLAGTVYDIHLFDEQKNRVGEQAGQGTFTVYLPYSDTNPADGMVDGTNIKETDLIIYHWDNGEWKPLPTEIKEQENIAWALVPHFSIFTLGGIPTFATNNNSVKVYPNPYKKDSGSTIWFDNVSRNATIRIYNIAGELVKEIEVIQSPQVWNILNESIASGIYIYTVTGGDGGKSVGKIGIVK